MPTRQFQFPIGEGESVSAVLERPRGAHALYVFAHGAGAGMHHVFMEDMATRLGRRGVATLRYHFRYMESATRRPPDARRVLERCVRGAIEAATRSTRGLPIVAGGKSMGGRISSHVMAMDPPGAVQGLVFLGFPLHPPKKPGTTRADHLGDVRGPMLFVQGTRDALADMRLMQPTVTRLGRRATLHVVDGADHGFHVLKRSGRTDDEAMDEIADAVESWIARVL